MQIKVAQAEEAMATATVGHKTYITYTQRKSMAAI